MMETIEKVTRFEVIDHRPRTIEAGEQTYTGPAGRVFVALDCEVTVALQDDGRTLKVFVNASQKWDHP
jgi:hypothetical protein